MVLKVWWEVDKGLTTREIPDRLYISPNTADHHIQHIDTKIGIWRPRADTATGAHVDEPARFVGARSRLPGALLAKRRFPARRAGRMRR
jgi:hypothetical protein